MGTENGTIQLNTIPYLIIQKRDHSYLDIPFSAVSKAQAEGLFVAIFTTINYWWSHQKNIPLPAYIY